MSAEAADNARNPPWAGLFADVEEHAVEAKVEGTIPEALAGGTVFRNGGVAGTGCGRTLLAELLRAAPEAPEDARVAGDAERAAELRALGYAAQPSER